MQIIHFIVVHFILISLHRGHHLVRERIRLGITLRLYIHLRLDIPRTDTALAYPHRLQIPLRLDIPALELPPRLIMALRLNILLRLELPLPLHILLRLDILLLGLFLIMTVQLDMALKFLCPETRLLHRNLPHNMEVPQTAEEVYQTGNGLRDTACLEECLWISSDC